MRVITVYATITGNNEAVADILCDDLRALGADVTKSEISQTDANDLADYDVAVIVPYTYDSGSLPDEGLDFYDDLADADLTGLRFGAAGSGDTFYEDDYCVAVDKFAAALTAAGAVQVTPAVKINLRPDDAAKEALADMAKALVSAV